MKILTEPLNSFTFDDIVDFSKEKQSEGVQLDYKKEFPDKGLAKIIAAFSNTRGGVIILGIEEDEKTGIPVAANGIIPGKHEDRINQFVGNISPIPKVDIYTTNESNGKVFVLIRVFEGSETPYYAYNDNNVWIRTGNICGQVDIVSPEGYELLYRKKDRAEMWRKINSDISNANYQAFFKNAESVRLREIDTEEENYKKRKEQHEEGEYMGEFKSKITGVPLGTRASILKIILQPFFQQMGFVKPRDIEPIITESRSRTTGYDFPGNYYFESIAEGMAYFNWVRSSGEITYQQVFANGLICSAHDVLHINNGIPTVYLSSFAHELFAVFTGMKKIFQKYGYQGSIVGEISIDGIDGVEIQPIVTNMFWSEIKKSIFSERIWPINLDTRILSDEERLNNYVTDMVRDIHWTFGYKDIQKGITKEGLMAKGYLKEG